MQGARHVEGGATSSEVTSIDHRRHTRFNRVLRLVTFRVTEQHFGSIG